MLKERIYINSSDTILTFDFIQDDKSFIVNENTNQIFSNKGNFVILKIKKQNLSTWELISYISQMLDIDEKLIGYAGLKDKKATTIQYVSIPKYKANDFKLLNTINVKVIDSFIHNKKLKIGDLQSNSFIIILHNFKADELPIFYQRLSHIQKHGMPNYFGYQRFGKEDNFKKSKAIMEGELFLKDKKLEKFLKTAYQSYFFNSWLRKRVDISIVEDNKKLIGLDGDILSINDHKIITGLLPGRDVLRANKKAREIEKEFDDMFIQEKGYRRDAMVYPTKIKNKLIDDKMILEFTLQKSSYATVFIEMLLNKNLYN